MVHWSEVGRKILRSRMIREHAVILYVPVRSEDPSINTPQYDYMKMR